MKTATTSLAGILFFLLSANGHSQDNLAWKKVTVLVYTKNGTGYVHDNIPSAVAAIQKLGAELVLKLMPLLMLR